jgi:ABC-type transporter MlaC component
VRDEGDGRSIAFSTVKLPSGEPARVDRTIEQAGNTFKIADVKVDGLSLTDTQRQEFAPSSAGTAAAAAR